MDKCAISLLIYIGLPQETLTQCIKTHAYQTCEGGRKKQKTPKLYFSLIKFFFSVNKINYETFDKSHYRVRTCHYLTQVKFELIPVFPASHIVLLKTGRDYPAVKLFTSLRFAFPISSNICKTLLLISVFTNPQSSLLLHSLSK